MIKVVSVETMRRVEAAANAAGISYATMMDHAGRAVCQRALNVISTLPLPEGEQARVTVLVGTGNNGGDGLVAARYLAQTGKAQVRCYLLRRRADDDPHYAQAREAGLFMANAEDDQRYRVLHNMVASAHVVIDALYGIGVRLPLEGEAERFLRAVHGALRETAPEYPEDKLIIPTSPDPTPHSNAPYVIAVDCPSGLNCDTGEADRNIITADETITFIAAKPGLFTYPGAQYVGRLTIASIGIPEDVEGMKETQAFVVDADTVRPMLPPRPDGSHKGTFGKALIVAGSVNYTGAAGLAAEAAYRAGAGLVTVAAPAPVIAALAAHLLEATWVLLPHDMGVTASAAAPVVLETVQTQGYDVLLIGPGMGQETVTGEMLDTLLQPQAAPRPRRAIGFGRTVETPLSNDTPPRLPSLVIDADGLNLLGKMEGWWTRLPPNTVLTPHPGEMARLTGETVEQVQANRWQLAARKAAEWNAIVLLKGAHTLIAAPDGRLAVLPFKTAALATAGTGDVLAGVITGLLSQGMPPFEAAVAASYIHGLAGERTGMQLGSTRSVIAGDVLRYGVPQAIAAVTGERVV